MRIRPVQVPGDLERVVALLGESAAVDGHYPIGEHKYLTLMSGGPDQVVGLVAETDGEVSGYVALTPGREEGWWGMEVAMGARHRSSGAFQRLLEAGVEEVRARGGKAIRAWIFHPGLAEAAVRAGFAPERELFKLEVQLPTGLSPNWPAGVSVGPFVVGRDEAEWLQLNNASFAGHPENGRWTREILEDRFGQPWFHPEDLIMARTGSRLAGFCWVKQAKEGAEIYVIAVAPEYQGRGLGRALVLEGLRAIEQAGNDIAHLYVDATNTVALHLYRSLGFFVDHVDRSFVWRPV